MDNFERNQLRYKLGIRTKRVFVELLIIVALILVFLPFWTSFQDILTRFVMSVGWYKNLQEAVVPYEITIIVSILKIAGLPIRAGNIYIEWTRSGGGNEVIYLIWNCVGWQTLILFAVSLISGLSGNYTLGSKMWTFAFGIFGTYLVNILRLVLVVAVYFFAGRSPGIVFHDYFSNLMSLVWLFFFWRFSYKFILESKTGG